MLENVRVASEGISEIDQVPSEPVTVPVAVPYMKTPTPTRGAFPLSVTFPFTLMFWACAARTQRQAVRTEVNILIMLFFIICSEYVNVVDDGP